MHVLGAIDAAPGRSERERIRHVAALPFVDEEGNTRHFTWRTIETWLVRYRKHGITVVHNKIRKDKGTSRRVTPEAVLEAVQAALPAFHNKKFTIASLYRHCIERGLLQRNLIAPNTFRRIVERCDMLKDDVETESKQRRAFSKQYANQMWQADTMFGPYLKTDTTPLSTGSSRSSSSTSRTRAKKPAQQAKLIAFLDDASRVVVHGEFFLQENGDTLIRALKSALYKRGVPEVLYVDNGSIYSSKEITLICARLGTILSHTPVRDGAAKGKVERFFRHVRESFLTRALDLSSLEVLNRQFIAWLEDEYNANRVQRHAGLPSACAPSIASGSTSRASVSCRPAR